MAVQKSLFPVARLADGRAFVNLGSSARVAPQWNNIDFSWIIRLGKHPRLCRMLHQMGYLSEDRYQRILALDPHTILWDLRKGVPFSDGTFDGVYHSHVLEHIDREYALGFIRECVRVVKPGGILRIVVPDFETLAHNYVNCLGRLPDGSTMADHDFHLSEMIDQMVVRIPTDRMGRKRIVRIVENVLIGDTNKNGVLHRWMYDRFSLGQLLKDAGLVDVQQHTEKTSGIPGWTGFNLDTEPDGSSYKHSSLYMEGRRPE